MARLCSTWPTGYLLLPPAGHLNFPRSILAWDVLVLNIYFVINFVVVTHIVYMAFTGRHYDKRVVVPLVLLSIPAAVRIHTVTAFLYNGLAARPYWNSSILAPQFLASAFCSGPAILLIVLFYGLAALFNLYIPNTGVDHSPPSKNPAFLVREFAHCVRLLWRDKLGQISLAVTTLFWGAGATLQFIVLKWAEQVLGLPAIRARLLDLADGVLTDAALLGSMVDTAVLVVRAASTPLAATTSGVLAGVE